LRMRIRKDPKLFFGPDPKKICKKEPYFQAKIRLLHAIIHVRSVVDPLPFGTDPDTN